MMELNPNASEITLIVPDAQRAEELKKMLAKMADKPVNIMVAPDNLQGHDIGPIVVGEMDHLVDGLEAAILRFLEKESPENFRRAYLGSFQSGGEPIADRLREVPVAGSELVADSMRTGQELRRDRRKNERRMEIAAGVINTAFKVAQAVKGRKHR